MIKPQSGPNSWPSFPFPELWLVLRWSCKLLPLNEFFRQRKLQIDPHPLWWGGSTMLKELDLVFGFWVVSLTNCPTDHMWPRAAMHAGQHKIVNLLKTSWDNFWVGLVWFFVIKKKKTYLHYFYLHVCGRPQTPEKSAGCLIERHAFVSCLTWCWKWAWFSW